MILDKRSEFATKLTVGAPNGSIVNVGDIVDLVSARDIGAGTPLYLVVQVTTAFTSGGSATVRFKLVSDGSSTIATDGTATEHVTSAAIAVATLTVGYQMVIPIPAESPAFERYLAFQVEEAASQALTAGSVNAFLTLTPSLPKSYADAAN